MSNHVQAPYTMKPSLKAFPVVWYFIMTNLIAATANGMFWAGLMGSTPLFLYLMLRTNHSYTLDGDSVTHVRLLTGKRTVIDLNRVCSIETKPIAFGTAHVVLTLTNGLEFKMKNVPLNIDLKPTRTRTNIA